MHIIELGPKIQPEQQEFAAMLNAHPEFIATAKKCGPAIAFLNHEGTVGASGLVDYPGTGRAMLWCVYASNLKRDFVSIYKQGMRLLTERFPRRRVEIAIDPAFTQAKRLAKLAGFKYEGLMESFTSDGKDHEMWALIRRTA